MILGAPHRLSQADVLSRRNNPLFSSNALIHFLPPKPRSVTNRPHVLEDPAVQALQERAHKIAEEGRAQQADERAEDDNIVGRLVSAASPSEFRTATGAPPRQYAIHQQQKSCD